MVKSCNNIITLTNSISSSIMYVQRWQSTLIADFQVANHWEWIAVIYSTSLLGIFIWFLLSIIYFICMFGVILYHDDDVQYSPFFVCVPRLFSGLFPPLSTIIIISSSRRKQWSSSRTSLMILVSSS